MDLFSDKAKEVVAIQFRGIITANLADVLYVVENDINVEWIPRARMTMMAACDLGPRWKEFAEAPSIIERLDKALNSEKP